MNDKKTKSNNNLKSDALFKSVMTEPLAAKEFLAEYLPAEIKDILNLDKISIEKDSFVEANLQRQLSDMVYSVKTKAGDDAFIYLLVEHQSSVDHLMAFRLAKYTLLLAERHIDKNEKIPLILPVVVYAGKSKYTAVRNLWQLFDNPELAKKILAGDFRLIDLNAMPDDQIIRKKHLAIFEYILKHIHRRDVLKLWQEIFDKMSHAVLLDQQHDYVYIRKFLSYTDAKVSEEKQEQLTRLIIDNLPKEDGEELMRTIADSYRDEGVNKGIAIGVEKTARRMLQENTDINFISSVTGLSIDDILKIQNKI